jgi:hypothetical protein
VADYSDLEANLRMLWSEVERGSIMNSTESNDDDLDVSVAEFGLRSGAVVFRGQAFEALESCVRDLADSALSSGGPRPEAAQALVVETCSIALNESQDAALAFLRSALSTGPSRYQVHEDIRGPFPIEELTIGACTIRSELPPDIAEIPAVKHLGNFPSGLLSVNVEAYDHESAVFPAQQRFAETRAILVLLAFPPYERPRIARIVGGSDGRYRISAEHSERFVPQRIDAEGSLWPGYSDLSLAAGKPDHERTDWEKRTLGAARWFREAVLATWQAQRLGALMSALECLLVPPGVRRGKGSQIAKHLPDRAYPPGHSREATAEWLKALYQHRNAAVHEATDYLEDLELDRLEAVTANIIDWGVWHLGPMHAHGTLDTACSTFAK